MANPVLHIKDSYYFDVPKFLWPKSYDAAREFPDVWVRLDPEFQHWEAERLYEELQTIVGQENEQRRATEAPLIEMPARDELLAEYEHWAHQHDHHGKPLDVFLEHRLGQYRAQYTAWKAQDPRRIDQSFDRFLSEHELEQEWFAQLVQDPTAATAWQTAKVRAGDVEAYKALNPQWSEQKIAGYNAALSGKVLIPQPFGELRNLYEKESGFAISRFMIIEVAVGILLVLLFARYARRVQDGSAPKGKLTNMLDAFLIYIRDQIARPAIGEHDGDKFVPLLWTLFMFILVMNLFGLVPWVGAPTGGWGVTFGLALITFFTGVVYGMKNFGPVGYFLNQIPHMDLPWYLAIFLKPVIFLIEMLGLLIKHAVLSIRLLANMVAGHLVLLAVLGMAFGAEAALEFSNLPGWQWGVTASVAVVASTIFSLLELFVAFLQAYIFTFLSAMFIGAAIHHH